MNKRRNSPCLLYAVHAQPEALHPGVDATFEACAKEETVAVKGLEMMTIGNSKMNGELLNQEKRVLKDIWWLTLSILRHLRRG